MHHKEKRPSEKNERAKTQPHNLPARSGWLQEERRLLNDMHHILQAGVFSQQQLGKQQTLSPHALVSAILHSQNPPFFLTSAMLTCTLRQGHVFMSPRVLPLQQLSKAGLPRTLQGHRDTVQGNPMCTFIAKRANIVFALDNWGWKPWITWQ